mgnify:CR=1 FL=1
MAEKQEFTRKLDEIYHNVFTHTKRMMETYAEEPAYRVSEEEGENEKEEVLKFFAERVISGVADALLDYFSDTDIYDMLDSAEFLREGKIMDKPTLKEAQDRVALIAGQKKLQESTEENVDEIIDKFCILMDWEVKPEDIQAVAETCGKYIMHLKDGTSFTYDPVNDCLTD